MGIITTYCQIGNPVPKEGDIVTCEHPIRELVKGRQYRVVHVNSGFCVHLTDLETGLPVLGYWGPWRFKLNARRSN